MHPIQEYYFKNLDRIADRYDTESLKDFLGDLSSSFDLIGYLENIIANRALFATVLSGSYTHDNGFDKIVLFSNDNLKIRLHIWWPNHRPFFENIHNHRWDFCSKLLLGSYENEVYVRDPRGIEYYGYEYHPINNSKHYSLNCEGKEILSLKDCRVYNGGDYLCLEHNILHKINSIREITTSLFVSGPLRKHTTSTFSKLPYTSGKIDYKYFQRDELKLKLRGIIEHLVKNRDHPSN